MSKLSAQCDELRSMSESVGLAMPQAATLMMEAADTIWELRGSVHRERAEADRLRTQLADVTESMGRVEERFTKLRELAGELWTYAEQELLCDENCPYGDTCDWMEPAVVCVFKRRMRELGIKMGGAGIED